MKMKKITLATIKSFIRKNDGNLFIKVTSRFDGMTDCCEPRNGGFEVVQKTDSCTANTLGIKGAWFVKDSGDYFKEYSDGERTGYEIYNCCGCFILAVPANRGKGKRKC